MVFARPRPGGFAELRAVSSDDLRALVERSPQLGARLIESAAKNGLHTAQLAWARMLLAGQGVAKDEESACRWFTIAAESGDPEAINMVGRCYELGWGVIPNARRSAVYYRQAARKNYAWAQYNLGQLLLAGEPSPSQRREGLGWHLVAAKAGHSKSMNVVGRFCEEGWEMPKSVDNALGWYRKSAQAGDHWGQFNLGRVLADDGDIEEALTWLRLSAETGNDEFVASIVPALTDHADPTIAALGREILARRTAKATAQEDGGKTPEAGSRPARTRFGRGWLFGGASGAPAR